MREILFRAKRNDNGEWTEGDLQQDRDLKIVYISGFHYYYDSEGLQREEFTCAVFPETICQYTGFKDKGGNRIWENDIVHFSADGLSGTGVVFWEQETASFRIKDTRKGKREKRIYEFYEDAVYRVDGNAFGKE